MWDLREASSTAYSLSVWTYVTSAFHRLYLISVFSRFTVASPHHTCNYFFFWIFPSLHGPFAFHATAATDSNTNGSYYYSNDNGSTYYNSGQGSSTYTSPSGHTTQSDGGSSKK